MSLEKKIMNLANIKEEIRKAIVAKGVDVPKNTSISEFAAKISEIKISKTSNRKEKV